MRKKYIFSILFLIALAQFFVFDMIYTYNWQGLNDKIYKQIGDQKYSWGELLCNLDNYPLMIIGTAAIIQVTKGIWWAKCAAFLLIDWLAVGLYFTIFANPFIENVGQEKLVLASLSIFISQVIIYHTWPVIKRIF